LNSPKSARDVKRSNISPETSSVSEDEKKEGGREGTPNLSDQQLNFQSDAYQNPRKGVSVELVSQSRLCSRTGILCSNFLFKVDSEDRDRDKRGE
jgi:hypothetical protein